MVFSRSTTSGRFRRRRVTIDFHSIFVEIHNFNTTAMSTKTSAKKGGYRATWYDVLVDFSGRKL